MGRAGFIKRGFRRVGRQVWTPLRAAGAVAGSMFRSRVPFPDGFVWGVATAAYQIEGAVNEGGRGESIWDRFSHIPGKIKDGHTGSVADDHYHRYPEDVKIMRSMGIKSYRFSIAWPRVQPSGKGAWSQGGLDFYERLVDALLKAGIEPFPTLYHWDLPQALEDDGGWPKRETAQHFADYADKVADVLGDRVRSWTIFNEPWMFTTLGYLRGYHAPGRTDVNSYLRATHVVNVAQGLAFRSIKGRRSKARVGSAFSMWPCQPATDSAADQEAAEKAHGWQNLWFLHPAMTGTYPNALEEVGEEVLGVEAGDMEIIRVPLDFLGINNYLRTIFAAANGNDDCQDTFRKFFPVETRFSSASGPKTDLGWEVYPKALYEIVMRITKEYNRPVIEITENGCAYNDLPNNSGLIRDRRRIEFHRGYLAELARAMRDGADVRSYHLWSLIDNFEWAEGFTQRFGLVHVDFRTQQRTWKQSAHWYAKVIAENALPAR
ncbi:MAG TPA: GH1 family beta-glucosidase [Candidatus Sulfotelmatobacter sp.]|nr:GH1 family beta-glucosidase [Candidatus Sulfotelmatobacter sp.]